MGSHALSILTRFQPLRHGFPFPNCFPCGKPVWIFRTPLFHIPIGDASKGLCGGMVFAAYDFFRLNLPVPQDPDASDLHAYLGRRLWNSFNAPWGICRIYQWMCRPDADHTRRGCYPNASVPYLTSQREWPRIRAAIRDRAEPVPLMVIKTASRNPWNMGLNHQVLAYGYDEDTQSGDVKIRIYDPNYPIATSRDEVTLQINTRDYNGRRVVHSREGESIRGFYFNRYSPIQPPAEMGYQKPLTGSNSFR